MCGRYGSWSAGTALAEYYHARYVPQEDPGESWNIAPGADVRVVVERAVPGEVQVRSLRAARWGLLAHWATHTRQAYQAFNARSETAATKPTFRGAFARFRVIVPADCWYEWLAPGRAPVAATSGSELEDLRAVRASSPDRVTRKRPFAVRRTAGRPLALAGLASWWRVPPGVSARPGPALHGGPEGEDVTGSGGSSGCGSEGSGWPWLLTCTILTRAARPDLAWLHDREPVVLADDLVDEWLNPACTDTRRLEDILGAQRPGLRWWEVSGAVGSPRAQGPQLVLPVESSPPVVQGTLM